MIKGNYLGNNLVYLEKERVNQWPDRRDRAVPHRFGGCGEKVCRPDRYVPGSGIRSDWRGFHG